MTYLESLQRGLFAIFAQDESVLLLGEDVLDPYGGAFKVTQGLSTAFPDRVLTTPISEGAIVGVGCGLALRGLRPIVEIMFGDFVTLAADQLINHAAKFRAMYGDGVRVPLVVRTPMGGGRGYGPTHSQSLEKLFLGVPHLRIVAPSAFHDPGRMLTLAVSGDDPVLFLEHKRLYAQSLLSPNSVEPDPFGFETALVRNDPRGPADVAIIGYGGASLLIAPLLERLAAEEIRAVCALAGSIQPIDMRPLIGIAREARRVLVVEEGSRSFGWGAEVAACLNEVLWGQLDRPVLRLAARDTVIPTARPLEDTVLPTVEKLEAAIYELVA